MLRRIELNAFNLFVLSSVVCYAFVCIMWRYVLCCIVLFCTQALWRTNHGYDPTIRQHYLWGQAPHDNSIVRYFGLSVFNLLL